MRLICIYSASYFLVCFGPWGLTYGCVKTESLRDTVQSSALFPVLVRNKPGCPWSSVPVFFFPMRSLFIPSSDWLASLCNVLHDYKWMIASHVLACISIILQQTFPAVLTYLYLSTWHIHTAVCFTQLDVCIWKTQDFSFLLMHYNYIPITVKSELHVYVYILYTLWKHKNNYELPMICLNGAGVCSLFSLLFSDSI